MPNAEKPFAARAYAGGAVLIIALGLWLRLPALFTGFTVDDFAQRAMMKGLYPVARAPLSLFTFSNGTHAENALLRAVGFFPWWSQPELKVSLMRPLSSALMWLDLRAFGDDAFLCHLHSACWWLLMMALLALWLRRLLPPGAALLALGLCAAHAAHALLLGWIANRNALVCSAFSLLGLWALVRARQDGARGFGWLAYAAFALALLAGEYAFGFFGYALLYELQHVRARGGVGVGVGARLRALLPFAALLLPYALLRAAFGFGTHASGMYIDPVLEPVAFARAALVRLPVLFGDLVLALRANWWSGGFPWAGELAQHGLLPARAALDLRPWRALALGLGVGAMALYALIARVVLRARTARSGPSLAFVALGVPLALVPALSSLPESRLLLPAVFGGAVVMAELVRTRVQAFRAPLRSPAHGLAAWAAFGLCALQLCLPLAYTWSETRAMPVFARAIRSSIATPALDPLLRDSRRVLLLSAADPTTTIYVPLIRALAGRPGPPNCQLLSAAFSPQRLTRVAEREFTLERLGAQYTAGDVYASAFNREPMRRGQRFTAGALRATVERVQDGRPLRVRFGLDLPLDDRGVVLLAQTWLGLQRVAFPPIGRSIMVDPPVPPLGQALLPH